MCVSNILFDTQSRLAVWLHIISVRSKLCSKVYDYRRPKTVTKGVTHTQVRVVDTQKQFSLYKRQPGIIGTKLQFLDAVAAAERFLIEARLCCEGVSLNVLEHNTYTQSMRMQRCKHTKIVIVGSSAQKSTKRHELKRWNRFTKCARYFSEYSLCTAQLFRQHKVQNIRTMYIQR